jgi:hypothetical protein
MARFEWNIDEFERIRKSPGVIGHLNSIGRETVSRCNAELHAAQAKRKQPVEDGYDRTLSLIGDRATLIITPVTARAMAHEAVNNAILKNLPVGNKPPAPEPNREIPQELGRRGAAVSGWGKSVE